MKSSAEYLEQAAKYDALAAQANEGRKPGYENLAALYRYFAEQEAFREERCEVSPRNEGLNHRAGKR